MGISVNGADIDDAVIAAELAHHAGAANPLRQSVHEVVLRTLLLQEADRLGIGGAGEDERIEALFEREVKVPHPDEAACERFHHANRERFAPGPVVQARHILFQVTPGAPLALLRATAQAVLEEVLRAPGRFPELARRYSNCPSGARGGELGQIARGQCVPEFERLVLRLPEGRIAERLLETRFGLHVVQVLRRAQAGPAPFEAVRERIAGYLQRQSWQRALHQYMKLLAGRADIAGVELEQAAGPLVR